MRKEKSKNALIVSVLSLMLCISMFISTTFAWFTDSVSTVSNKMVAGSLQVDLELLEKDGSWTSIKESGKPIFDYDKWEPSYTDVKILRVVNKGTLALKWVAKFVADNELSDLAKVIDVYVSHDITSYPSHRIDLKDWERIGTIAEFVNKIGETANGNLIADDAACLGIAFKMQETAGNEYQGMSLGEFDIQIFATQYTHEEDSFDNTYDAEADSPLTQSVYFRSLRGALHTVTGGTISDSSSDCGEQDASASVKWENGQYVVTLLDAITENASLEVTENLTLDLNGNSVTFTGTDVGFLIPQGSDAIFRVDGQVSGSSISISGDARSTAIQINAGTCIITGGTYTSNAQNAGTEGNPNPCIDVKGNAVLKIFGATIAAADTDKGTPCGIYVAENSYLSGVNCDILAAAPYGLGVHGVHNLGNAVISDSSMKGYAHYTANKAGTTYASHSRGVYNSGEMTVVDCYVIGTHSGITSVGTLFVDGGTYESYGHGGIYFGGSNTTSYIKDATVRWSQMPDGYFDDGVAGTNKAGMYIGGASKRNIVVYADNCQFDAPSQSIVIRGTSGEQNDVLYISNSTINTSAKIRIDANNQLCIGHGNNFTAQHTRSRTSVKGTVETTDVNYRAIIDAAFQANKDHS